MIHQLNIYGEESDMKTLMKIPGTNVILNPRFIVKVENTHSSDGRDTLINMVSGPIRITTPVKEFIEAIEKWENE